jgi:hypothetical protein
MRLYMLRLNFLSVYNIVYFLYVIYSFVMEFCFSYRPKQSSLQALDLKPNYVRAWANMGISYANQVNSLLSF